MDASPNCGECLTRAERFPNIDRNALAMPHGTPPQTVGARLREAREKRGVSLRQIANSTRISVMSLEALERNDMTLDGRRIDILRRAAAELLGIEAAGDIAPWCGLRPATPDSRPIIGWSPLDGLFINSGHGMLGWTLACGSARLTADMIERKRPATEASAFALRRAA